MKFTKKEKKTKIKTQESDRINRLNHRISGQDADADSSGRLPVLHLFFIEIFYLFFFV